MGKVTSIYLTDEEAVKLKKFYETNNYTQYTAIKTAMKEIISKRIAKTGDMKLKKDEAEGHTHLINDLFFFSSVRAKWASDSIVYNQN